MRRIFAYMRLFSIKQNGVGVKGVAKDGRQRVEVALLSLFHLCWLRLLLGGSHSSWLPPGALGRLVRNFRSGRSLLALGLA